jgi:DNA-binding MarR family transcriptional regulator
MDKRFEEEEKFRYFILAAQRRGNRLFMDLLKEIGITPSQAEVISILKSNQSISLKDLGELLICEEGSPSRLIERMVQDQLVERVKDGRDSRFVRLQLTGLGFKKYSLLIEAESELYKMLEQIYTSDELQFMNQLLSRLFESSLSQTLSKRGLIT